MDCAKLKADIERLWEARDAFDAAVAETEANDTGLGKIKCNDAMKRTSELEDEILQTYMEDARKHNPELLHHFRYGERIDGIRGDILSTMKLSDNEVLVCGAMVGKSGETRILHVDRDIDLDKLKQKLPEIAAKKDEAWTI